MNEDAETDLKKRRNVAILSSDEESEDLSLNQFHSSTAANPTKSNDFATLEKRKEEGENSSVAPSITPIEAESNSGDVANASTIPATSASYSVFRWVKE